MAEHWTRDRMRELGQRHAGAEARRDLDETMATLVEEPAYEFWPVGLALKGRDRVRRYHEHLFSSFNPRARPPSSSPSG